MGFQIQITAPAIADLAEIVSYIAQDNPDAAAAVGNNLLDAALRLAETPHKGSSYRRLSGIRKLTVRPFKIFYRVNETRKAVEVLRFWHSAPRTKTVTAILCLRFLSTHQPSTLNFLVCSSHVTGHFFEPPFAAFSIKSATIFGCDT